MPSAGRRRKSRPEVGPGAVRGERRDPGATGMEPPDPSVVTGRVDLVAVGEQRAELPSTPTPWHGEARPTARDYTGVSPEPNASAKDRRRVRVEVPVRPGADTPGPHASNRPQIANRTPTEVAGEWRTVTLRTGGTNVGKAPRTRRVCEASTPAASRPGLARSRDDATPTRSRAGVRAQTRARPGEGGAG
jgi:hypothetical protein